MMKAKTEVVKGKNIAFKTEVVKGKKQKEEEDSDDDENLSYDKEVHKVHEVQRKKSIQE